jgi:hypothetical protein
MLLSMESMDGFNPEGPTLEDELEEIINTQNSLECLPGGSATGQSTALEIEQKFTDELFRTF